MNGMCNCFWLFAEYPSKRIVSLMTTIRRNCLAFGLLVVDTHARSRYSHGDLRLFYDEGSCWRSGKAGSTSHPTAGDGGFRRVLG